LKGLFRDSFKNISGFYSKTRSNPPQEGSQGEAPQRVLNPPQEGSQGEAPQRVLYFNLWRV